MNHAMGLLAAGTLPASVVLFLIIYLSSKYLLKKKLPNSAAVFMFIAIWAIATIVQVVRVSERAPYAAEGARASAKSRDLKDVELENLEGEAQISQGFFRGRIYNGNRNVEVSSVEVVVVNEFNGFEENHVVTVIIPPLTWRDVSFKCIDTDYKPHRYYFAAATGRRPTR